MPPKKPQPSVTQNVTGDNNVVIAGNENTVNQTIIQKFFNIFKSDAETVDQRNRRIMLGHVENFWVKGILEKSLHGAALLELGIKEDPDALTYPWAIKREANKETLPAGTSMLEIFQEIGMGRSLLILGAPGTGKTTMLLELTRQLIDRAREDVTEPIPVVFNLSSWTEKLTLADWLARELNIIYTIPKKVAPTWVKENKMLLLLDGLDEVRQESRGKCVDAINQFRKENGLTSLAVSSRIQDYAELKTRLSFDGAIEIQPLTSKQVDEYFERFGEGLAGIRQVLERDIVLREMAETPMFLSVMTLTYRDIQSQDILVTEDFDVQRRHLFDTYIDRMFKRPERSKSEKFNQQDVSHWLSWLAQKLITYNHVPYLIERMQPNWLIQKKQVSFYKNTIEIIVALIFGLSSGIINGLYNGLASGISIGVFFGFTGGLAVGKNDEIRTVDALRWNWKAVGKGLSKGLQNGLSAGVFAGLIGSVSKGLIFGIILGLSIWLGRGLMGGIVGGGLNAQQVNETARPGQRLFLSIMNFFFAFSVIGFLSWLSFWLVFGLFINWAAGSGVGDRLIGGQSFWLIFALTSGLSGGIYYGGLAVIQHYSLRYVIASNKYLPYRLIPFLDYCCDLIFLRRVGGGYIFVHRLLMEHFADMYPADEK